MELKTSEVTNKNVVEVAYDIVNQTVNDETIKIVNGIRKEENKEEIKDILPIYANPDDAGADIYATSCKWDEENDCWVYGTNFRFEPPKGWFLEFRPRSSNRKTECYLANSPATGDYGYRGEYIFCFKPRTSTAINKCLSVVTTILRKVCAFIGLSVKFNFIKFENNPPYQIGERIGQMFCFPYYHINFVKKDLDPSKTLRGAGGHGSTGK